MGHGSADLYSSPAAAYREIHDRERENADYTDAVGLNPNEPLYYAMRGESFKIKGEQDKARAHFAGHGELVGKVERTGQ